MRNRKLFKSLIVATILLSPFLGSLSAEGLVPCGTTASPEGCDFNSLITLIQKITEFLLILAVSVATLLFAWAGFQYITAAGDMGKIKSAHKIFWSVFWGIVFMAGAWLFVKVIIDTLKDPNDPNPPGDQFLENIEPIL